MIKFKLFDKRKLGQKERKFIKKHNFKIFNFPRSINKNNLKGYALKDEIFFKDKTLNKFKVILLKNSLSKQELQLTFWHEVAHFLLRKKGQDKNLNRQKKELFCENYAYERIGKL